MKDYLIIIEDVSPFVFAVKLADQYVGVSFKGHDDKITTCLHQLLNTFYNILLVIGTVRSIIVNPRKSKD